MVWNRPLKRIAPRNELGRLSYARTNSTLQMKTLKAMAKSWKQHAASSNRGEESFETNDAVECLFSAFKIYSLRTLYYNNTSLFGLLVTRPLLFLSRSSVVGRSAMGGWM
jgi:hypothetical protein